MQTCNMWREYEYLISFSSASCGTRRIHLAWFNPRNLTNPAQVQIYLPISLSKEDVNLCLAPQTRSFSDLAALLVLQGIEVFTPKLRWSPDHFLSLIGPTYQTIYVYLKPATNFMMSFWLYCCHGRIRLFKWWRSVGLQACQNLSLDLRGEI